MWPERIKCVCPACHTAYHIPAKALGRQARCRACGTTFRVGERVPHPPTEDDVIRWLREAEDDDEAAIERREAADELLTLGAKPGAGPLSRKRRSA